MEEAGRLVYFFAMHVRTGFSSFLADSCCNLWPPAISSIQAEGSDNQYTKTLQYSPSPSQDTFYWEIRENQSNRNEKGTVINSSANCKVNLNTIKDTPMAESLSEFDFDDFGSIPEETQRSKHADESKDEYDSDLLNVSPHIPEFVDGTVNTVEHVSSEQTLKKNNACGPQTLELQESNVSTKEECHRKVSKEKEEYHPERCIPEVRKCLGRINEIHEDVKMVSAKIKDFDGNKGTYLHLQEMLLRVIDAVDQVNAEGRQVVKAKKKFVIAHAQTELDLLEAKYEVYLQQ